MSEQLPPPPSPEPDSGGGGGSYPPPPPPPPPGAGLHPGGGGPAYPAPAYPPIPTPGEVESVLLYPAAPITLVEAVASEQAGAWTKKPLQVPTWGLGDVGITFAAWFFLSMVAGIAAFAITDGAGVSAALKGLITIIAVMIPWIGMGGWPLFAASIKGNGPSIDLGLRWSMRDIAWGLMYGVIALVTAIILGAVTTAIFGEFDSAAGDLGEQLSGNKLILLLFALTVGVGAPIIEEICFRGLTFSAIAKRGVAPWLTVIISAAIFSIFHLEPVRMILLLGIGLVLGFARWHTGSVTTTIVAHMMNNLPGAIFLLLS